MKKSIDHLDSVVLGLNDALIELTAVLAGLTLALQNTKLIAATGLVTGIAASLSMAASEYLSKKSENRQEKKPKQHPSHSATRTGLTYIITVLLLIFPFMILSNPFYALSWAILNAIIIIFIFTYSTSKKSTFSKRFTEMLILSMGIALITFFLGLLIRNWFNISV